MRYDAIIIGSGPAGLEAAVNLKIRKKSFLLFGNKNFSEKLTLAPEINNFLGFYRISGKSLKDKFSEHLNFMGIEIKEEKISNIYNMGKYFAVAGSKNNYEALSVIFATGVYAEKPLKGENRLLGRGVGYCATCDAPLYKGKDVAIIGYNEEAEHEANFVAELAATVYYIPMKPVASSLRGDIRLINDIPVEIVGSNAVSGLILKNSTISVNGIFILRNSISPSYLMPELELENGFIKVDIHMNTSVRGIFAAGDCTGKPHQYMRAAGQGQTAALNAAEYIDKINENFI